VTAEDKDPLAVTLGERVREWREAVGDSLAALANKCGLNKTHLGQIERGERDVTLTTLRKLGKGFGVDAGVLLAEPPPDWLSGPQLRDQAKTRRVSSTTRPSNGSHPKAKGGPATAKRT